MFNSILLVIVSQHYEKEVLYKVVTSDINIMQAICFCNISTQQKAKNKRAQLVIKADETN